VVADAERGVLLLWRHRFITDTWGWEIPAGRVDEGELPADAAHRETVEETGWAPGRLDHLVTFHPVNGLSDLTFTVFVADGATELGPPTDITEAARVEWVPIDQLRDLLRAGEVRDGLSLGGLSTALALGVIGH
jgi:8-oxo-dGTP pyrophosphatase MutT (NUDIX family)